ncbi:hypothetical protein [Rickettsia endosymbiont of Gonocerus acuteangulatus]|uniref:hypothetical protein n=1 Tax=Rickettsia endosymbiont of Gonocerus acuteangulatus TaxID=3066266 RepID=UPI0031333A16
MKKNNILDKIYIGHQDTEISQDSLEDLQFDIDVAKHKNAPYDKRFEAYLNYILKNQQEILAGRKVPIKLTNDSFMLYGKDGEILNELAPDQMKGEFAWFCTSKYLLKNYTAKQPLITCELDALAQLDPKDIA